MATKTSAKPIDVGDEVMILERGHPAYRKTGTVTEGPHHMRFAGAGDPDPWIVVAIDGMGGHECGVHLKGVKRVRDLR